MTICSIDLETRSAIDLRKAGAWRYFEDATSDVLCAAFCFEDEPPQVWQTGQPCPARLRAHIEAGGMLAAWNATFEHWAFVNVLGPRQGWPVPRPDQWIDTMAQAAAQSIPQALAGAAQALGLEQQKDKDGARLIRKFSIPRKAKNGEDPNVLRWNEPGDHAEDFAAFVKYCAQDVIVERELRKKLVPLPEAEQAIWVFNLEMNTRGVQLDMTLVEAMLKITEQAKARLDREMAIATDFKITACTQVAALTAWLQTQGVPAEKLNKNAIEDLLATDLPEKARRAVELRKESAKTSTAKLNAMQACVGADGRARGLHLYHGAGTGRWSGRLVQTQNMTRGSGVVKDPASARLDMLHADAGWVDLIFGQPMSAVSDMLRSCLIASPKHRLLAADYSSIEGRVTAWVAGETDELDAYRANDAGTGAGIYEIAAGGIFNVDPFAVTKGQRQVGKAASLALGFGGGVVAFDSMAAIYGIDMAPVFPILQQTSSPEVFEDAAARYDDCNERGDTGTDVMSREAWIASEITKVLWRQKHPATVELWAGLERAAREAVMSPGSIVRYGCVAYLVNRGFLWCRLPSGRCLAYGSPRIEDRLTPWGASKPSVTALGVDSVTKRWMRFALYGGLLAENVVQAIARDLIANGMLKAEAAGYPIVMTVHDEAVADVPDGFGSLEEFTAVLCDLPEWADGIPLTASGYESQFYKKD